MKSQGIIPLVSAEIGDCVMNTAHYEEIGPAIHKLFGGLPEPKEVVIFLARVHRVDLNPDEDGCYSIFLFQGHFHHMLERLPGVNGYKIKDAEYAYVVRFDDELGLVCWNVSTTGATLMDYSYILNPFNLERIQAAVNKSNTAVQSRT